MQLKAIEQYQEVIVLDHPKKTARMVAASRPIPLIQSFAGPSIWACLTVSRFADHLPYYRERCIGGVLSFGRHGFADPTAMGRRGVVLTLLVMTRSRDSCRPKSFL